VTVIISGPQIRALGTVQQLADDYAGQAEAPRTVRAYASDWRDFVSWAEAHRRQALPAEPDTVAMYLADLAARAVQPATLARRLVAISQAHKAVDLPTPTSSSVVRRVHAGIRRTHGTAQLGKAPAVVGDLRQMIAALPDSERGLRDRALLLVGFAGAFRRSELVSLDVEDLEFSRSGLAVTLRRSKTDQEGQGRRIGIPYGTNELTCPVRSLQAWLTAGRHHLGADLPPGRPLRPRPGPAPL
jgi:site-specific recombinase XerD